jgi:hypothetical protein
MKRYIIILTVILSTAFFTSCKKMLAEKMHSSLSPDNFYKTEADAEAALNGVFSQLQYQDYYQRTIYLIADLSADIFQPNNASSDRVQLYTGTYTATNGQLYAWWSNIYTLIKNANDVITYVPDINMDDTKKNNILGNAHFLRGMAYFDLVRSYGDVPLVLHNGGDQDLFPPRTSSDSVYSQVISDLQFAEANCLPADQIPGNEIGRVSSEAASGMLARVYLQRASTGFAVSTDNQSALDECNKIIQYSAGHPDVLALVPNYADIFDVSKKNGPECIFSIEFGDPPNNNNITNLMFDPEAYGGYASFLPLASFYNSFDALDKRKAVDAGTVVDGITYISKYHDPGVAPGGFGRTNFIVIRYADILLMQSEAMNNINPADINKFSGINAVRTRAGLGSKLLDFSNTPTGADFINALVNERLWELCLEGHRRWDLIRLNKFLPVKASQGFSLDESHKLFPIPQNERDVNKNLTQNPGY